MNDYRVLWSRPNCSEMVAGIFSARNDTEANEIFKRDFKDNHLYVGDILVLICIDRPEQTRIVERREAA